MSELVARGRAALKLPISQSSRWEVERALADSLDRIEGLEEQLEACRARYDELKIAKNEQRDELQEQLGTTRIDAARAAYLAEYLFQMIGPETWRDTGGDDGQGHYEGDYRAEKVRDELVTLSLRVSNPASKPEASEREGTRTGTPVQSSRSETSDPAISEPESA